MRSFNSLERILALAGLVLLAVFGVAETQRLVMSQVAIARFRAAQRTVAAADRKEVRSTTRSTSAVDFHLWSTKRIQAYLDSLTTYTEPPLGILRVDRLQIETPIFNGTDESTLNRGAGRIIGSGLPGAGGNMGISGHRDGFFRALKDVRIGDSIKVELLSGKVETYVVDEIQVVTPDNVSILKPRALPSVTLVTCYPFYFIGSAPKRFIVQGSLMN